jgi:hypothetical protein
MFHNKEYQKTSEVYENLKKFVAENNCPLYTAVQVANPNARIYDKQDFTPDMIFIDYVFRAQS